MSDISEHPRLPLTARQEEIFRGILDHHHRTSIEGEPSAVLADALAEKFGIGPCTIRQRLNQISGKGWIHYNGKEAWVRT